MEGPVPNIEELQKNLNHQLALYRQLVDLLREEHEHVVGVRLKEIRECTYAKEALLDEIQREEFRRARWTREAAAGLRMAESEVTMEIIASQIGGPALYESLMSLKLALVHMVKKAREMNYENHKLVESALKDAQELKRNILGLSSEQPQVYGPKGSMGSGVRDQSARFLSKEA
jgi:flagellar biosynthesis/type III secretory pathway chaperone